LGGLGGRGGAWGGGGGLGASCRLGEEMAALAMQAAVMPRMEAMAFQARGRGSG